MGDRSMIGGRGLCHLRRTLLIVALIGVTSSGRAGAGFIHGGKFATVGRVPCRVGVIEGEVVAGQVFERPIGNGLRVFLEPLVSGWLLRVLPAQGPRGRHDYAELATPPYQSVSPLLLSTDYSFRAQDALAWNPRRFRFAVDRRLFNDLQGVYDEYQRLSTSRREGDSATRQAGLRIIEGRLAALVSRAPEGELAILDAHLVQGTADQAGSASMVASHLKQSAHEVDQPADGGSTPLGRISSLRFRIRLNLPDDFHADDKLAVQRSVCP